MEQGAPIFLVACCGPKLAAPAPAADLCVSDLFKKSKTYAEKRGRWFILSALYGLLDPIAVTAPYDVTLKKMVIRKRREWGKNVWEQMANARLIDQHLIALAGTDYVKPLVEAGLKITQPMKGLGIGKQLQWLLKENGESVQGNARDIRSRL